MAEARVVSTDEEAERLGREFDAEDAKDAGVKVKAADPGDGPLPKSYIDAVKRFEGFTPIATWDVNNHRNGYGTNAKHPREIIDEEEATKRLHGELKVAAKLVDTNFPDLAEGPRAALTSLTFNAGPSWMSGRLGQAVADGNMGQAKGIFMNYNRSAGQYSHGLANRRAAEAQWFTGGPPESSDRPSQAPASKSMAGRYNTKLTEDEQQSFSNWADRQQDKFGRDVRKDMYDYDMQGLWKDSQGADLDDGHVTDKYKKPNHPTFSNESKYHGVDGNVGGQWTHEGGDRWSYEPSATNLQHHSPVQLRGYFDHVEHGNRLNLGKEPLMEQGVAKGYAGLLDWFGMKSGGTGAQPEHKGPGPAFTKAPFPSDEEAEAAEKGGYGVGTPEDFFQNKEFRVTGGRKIEVVPATKKGGKPTTREAAREVEGVLGLEPTEVAKIGDDPEKSFTIKPGDKGYEDVKDWMKRDVGRAALASRRSALATLGFNPALAAITPRNYGGFVGSTDPTSQAEMPEGKVARHSMWISGNHPFSTMVHEAIHRGMSILEDRREAEYKPIMEKFKRNSVDEETIVRQIMRTAMGNIEELTYGQPSKQIDRAKFFFEEALMSDQNMMALKKLEDLAADEYARSRRGGPR